MDIGLAYRSFIPVREQMVFKLGAVAVGHEAVYDAGLDVCPRRNGVESDIADDGDIFCKIKIVTLQQIYYTIVNQARF